LILLSGSRSSQLNGSVEEEGFSEQLGSEQDWSDDDIPIEMGGLIADFLCLRQRITSLSAKL